MIESTGANPAHLSPSDVQTKLLMRASLLARIREYFARRDVVEVETPLLSHYPVTDPQLENLQVSNPFARNKIDKWLYLNTSPEYAMKQLLSLGSGSIYQIVKAFRQDQPGHLHSMEFTLLEWYRVDFDMQQLMDDVAALIHAIDPDQTRKRSVQKLCYRDAFIQYADIDPFTATAQQLEAHTREFIDIDFTDQPKDTWLDLLLTHRVEPRLGHEAMTFIYDYPESQAALAQLRQDDAGNTVAARFELYMNGIELANGYQELTDAEEQLARFEHDNVTRRAMGKAERAIDQNFIASLRNGLPDCSGVALGIDRLLLALNE